MSQVKVDAKKEQKKNRKSAVRLKKFEYAVSMFAILVVSVGVIGWIVFSTYTKLSGNEETTYEYHDVTTDAIQDYVSSLY